MTRTRRGSAAVATLVGASLLLPAVAAADDEEDDGPCGVNQRGRAAVCLDEGDDGAAVDPIDHPAGDGWTPPDDWELATWLAPGSEDGVPCTENHAQWMHEDDVADHVGARNYAYFLWYDRSSYTIDDDGNVEHISIDDCEAQPDDAGLPPEMVLDVITTQLPLPAPQIEPGWSLTGLPAYLEIGAPTTYTAEVAGEALPVVVTFEASASYRVVWGDGTVTEHVSAGGPYPDGDVTHTYADAGEHTVTVTPIWNISAQGGGQSFSFEDVELVSSSVEAPVRELQSVRTSGRERR